MMSGYGSSLDRDPAPGVSEAVMPPLATAVHDGVMAVGGRMRRWVVVFAGGLLIAGLGVFLAVQNLDKADKWSSVFGLFVGLAGLGIAVSGVVGGRRQSGRDHRPGRDRVPVAAPDHRAVPDPPRPPRPGPRRRRIRSHPPDRHSRNRPHHPGSPRTPTTRRSTHRPRHR